MRRNPCRELAEHRSAYVDGALPDAERERLLTHLVGCAACRADVDDLRAVRALLNRMGQTLGQPPAAPELSSRLVSIAGHEAHEPVWSRPFRRTGPGELPSARRRLRRRASAAALALGGLSATLAIVGYAAAPVATVRALGDPTERVRSEFASTLTQFPLASRSLNAVMMTPQSRLRAAPGAERLRGSMAPALPLPSGRAAELLSRASEQADRVSFSGIQQVTATSAGQTISATVRISSEAGHGASVGVFDRSGQEVVEGFLPAPTRSQALDRAPLALLHRDYALSGWVGGTVVGRPVSVVEATSRSAVPGVVARWWIDDTTGLLLWQETYDASGDVSLAAGFTSVTISRRPNFIEHLAPRLAHATATASLALSDTGWLDRQGWSCPDELAGLSLVTVRGEDAADPSALHLVYSDGVATLSVFEQRGRLTGPPAQGDWDPSLGAYLSAGTPTMATWQSGDRLLTVVTDGSPDLVRRAVASLPHARLSTPTTMGRVHAGWSRIVERVVR